MSHNIAVNITNSLANSINIASYIHDKSVYYQIIQIINEIVIYLQTLIDHPFYPKNIIPIYKFIEKKSLEFSNTISPVVNYLSLHDYHTNPNIDFYAWIIFACSNRNFFFKYKVFANIHDQVISDMQIFIHKINKLIKLVADSYLETISYHEYKTWNDLFIMIVRYIDRAFNLEYLQYHMTKFTYEPREYNVEEYYRGMLFFYPI